jgi:hypothetical protein
VDINAAEKWPADEFDVDAYLEKGGPKATADDAIAAALKAIEKNGGGVLKFGPHVYSITRTIVVPRLTVLRGAGSRRTIAATPRRPGADAAVRRHHRRRRFRGGRRADLQPLRADDHSPRRLCSSITLRTPLRSSSIFVPGKRARNVAVRRCHLVMRIDSHEDRRVDTDGGKYKGWVQAYMLSQGQAQGGFTAITFRGDGLEVEDNTIFGGGSCVMMRARPIAASPTTRSRSAPPGTVSTAMGHLDWPEGPKTVNGGAKITGITAKHIIIEDNQVSGYSQTARDGVYLMYGVEKSHVARNRITNIESTFDAEGLGMHLWSGRWNHARHGDGFAPGTPEARVGGSSTRKRK